MSVNSGKTPPLGGVGKGAWDGQRDALDPCVGLPIELRKLLMSDPSVVVGLCLRPDHLSAQGRKLVLRLLDIHAQDNAAARGALAMLGRKGRAPH